MAWYKNGFKPAVDRIIALILAILLLPLFAILVCTNTLVFKNPFFIQKRIGKNEKVFLFFKLRSMKKDADESSIPSWGKFLRKTSLDELPQLLNILKGEMSFVGPRPLLPEYVAHYSPEQAKRHLVKPGITGLAQVKGRNTLSWTESLAFDSYYATHCSIALDISILAQTIPQLVKFNETEEKSGVSRTAFNREKK